MFNFFKKPKTQEYTLFDFCADAIATSVITIKNDQLELSNKFEQRLPKAAVLGTKILNYEAVLEAASFSLQNTFLTFGKRVKKAFFLFSGGAMTGVSLVVKINRRNQSPLSEKELSFIIEKAQPEVIQKGMDNLSSLGFDRSGLEFLNFDILSFRFDGKTGPSPLATTAKTLEAIFYLRFIRKAQWPVILELANDLKLEPEYFWEKTPLLSLGLLELQKNGAVLNSGLGFSDITALADGRILPNLSFDLGLADFRQNPEVYRQSLQLGIAKILKAKKPEKLYWSGQPPLPFESSEWEQIPAEALKRGLGWILLKYG